MAQIKPHIPFERAPQRFVPSGGGLNEGRWGRVLVAGHSHLMGRARSVAREHGDTHNHVWVPLRKGYGRGVAGGSWDVTSSVARGNVPAGPGKYSVMRRLDLRARYARELGGHRAAEALTRLASHYQ